MRRGISRAIAATSRWAINNRRLGPSALAALSTIDTRIAVPGTTLTLRATSPIEAHRAATLLTKEPETIAWLDREFREGDVLYDVGANVGVYSLYPASRTRGRVYAFEPVPATYAHLWQNVLDNRLADRVFPLPLALSSRSGTGSLALSDLAAGAAFHGRAVPATGPVATVPTVERRMDDLDLEPPTLLKIDVDGFELEVLDGAAATLASETLRSVLVEAENDLADGVDERLVRAGFELAERGPHKANATNCIYVRR
jgi:FkbM family methyltransferase